MRNLRRIRNFLCSPLPYLRVLRKLFSISLKVLANSNLGQLKILSENELSTHYRGSINKFRHISYREEWTKASQLAKEGYYRESVLMRQRLLRDSRASLGLRPGGIPNLLESDFVSHYGHLALASYAKEAASLNLIAPRRFQLIANLTKIVDRPLLRSALCDIQVIDSQSTHSIFDHDAFFGLSEKTLMLTSEHGFEDMQAVINSVEESATSKIRDAFLSEIKEHELLDFEILCEPFRKIGVDWFVCLQIRDTIGKNSSRNNSFENYFLLIDYVNMLGGFVIVIGDYGSNSASFDAVGVLDLRVHSVIRPFLTDIAIGFSSYFIGPDSGPTAHAIALGVPTLRADGVAIMKNTYSTHAPSISLPKFWTDSGGKKLNWLNVVETELGFREEVGSNCSFRMNSNSSEDILEAFKELVELTRKPHFDLLSSNNREFLKIKEGLGGIGSGRISEIYFED